MNKVLHINLGNTPFVIDENAYETLANYMNGLRKHFSGSEGCDEIVADIEARIAELFADYLQNRQIVTLPDVKRAISVMGIPTDIESNTNTAQSNNGSANGNAGNWKAGKRLFRNEDDKVIGGVCSGLAAYLGFTDPLWMRLAWAGLLFFSVGSVSVIYILLLIIVPKAQTAADKLAMRGENVNVDNIAKTVEQELGSIGQRLGEFGNEIGETFGGKKSDGGSFGTTRTGSTILTNGSDTFIILLKALVKAVVLFFIGVALFSLIVTWLGFIAAGVHIYPYSHYFVDSPTAAYVGAAAFMLALIVPIIALVLAIIRIFYKNVRINSVAKWGLALTFLGSILTLIVIGTTTLRQFYTHDSSSQNIALQNPNTETLSIEFSKDDEDNMDISFADMFLRGDRLMSDDIEFNVEQSPDAQFHLIQKNNSRGSTALEARRSADAIEYNIAQTDSSLRFAPLLSLPKGEKCRWQSVKLTLQVPVGKKIKVKNVEDDKNRFHYYTEDIYLAKTESCKDDEWENDPREVFMYKTRTWRMTQNGLVCEDCTPQELKSFGTNNDLHDDEDSDRISNDDDDNENDDEDKDNNTTEKSDSNTLNINGNDAKIKIDKDGLRIKAKDKDATIDIKVDESGLKIKKNGKVIESITK